MKILEKRLYELRRKKNFTQEELASALDVTRQTISNWETGTAKPKIDKAIDLAKIYGISLDELVGNARTESKQISLVMKQYEKSKGTLIMCPVETQPFFPSSKIKNVEIIEVHSTSIKIRIFNKHSFDQLVFIKDILGFIKVVE